MIGNGRVGLGLAIYIRVLRVIDSDIEYNRSGTDIRTD